MYQTYDYYKEKEYKGLDREQVVDVHKAKIGQVGIATGYKDIKEETESENLAKD